MKKTILTFGMLVAIQLIGLEVDGQTITYSLAPQKCTTSEQLLTNFISPPDEVKMRVYWWWLNGMATKRSITRDLEQMRAKGIGGATIMDAGSSNYEVATKTTAGPVFMSEEWMENYRHAVKEAERLGIELSINLQTGWNPGAPCVTPEDATKRLTYSVQEVSGPQQIEIELTMPDNKLLYKDVLVQAYPLHSGMIDTLAISYWTKKSLNESLGWKGTYPLNQLDDDTPLNPGDLVIKKSDIIDLTSQFKDGKLKWNVPAGKWKIIRYGMTCTGAMTSTTSDGWSGLSYDHLSAKAFRLFADSIILPLIQTAFVAGNSLKYLHTDSWEMGTTNWTPLFMDEFKALRGYDMTPYMPVMAGKIVESKELSNRFLRDVRRTVADLVLKNHYKLMSDLAHSNGLGIHPESGGPHSAPVDGLEIMGLSDIPTGEFWACANTHRIADDERLAVRQAANAAHTHGRRFAMAEGPTSIGPQWERAPRDLKANIDRVFCTGINRILWHTFTNSPEEFGLPGNEYFAGTHLNPNTTWWPYAGDFINYINRCSYLLSEGLYQSDVLYYYGDNAPNYVFLKEDVKDIPFGYGFDKCSKDVLMQRAFMRNGKLSLPDGMNYRVLVLPDNLHIAPELLPKIEQWIKEGLTVVGNKPVYSVSSLDSDANDKDIQTIANRVWGDVPEKGIKRYGQGHICFQVSIEEVLNNMQLNPDFGFTSTNNSTKLDFIHRYTDNADFYFVINCFSRKTVNDYTYRYITDLADRYETVECRFRVTGKVPEIWNPITGTVRRVAQYKEENGYTSFNLTFDPEGSIFVVFREKAESAPVMTVYKDGEEQECDAYSSVLTGRPVLYSNGWQLKIESTQAGKYRVKDALNKLYTATVKDRQKVKTITGPWLVSFDEKRGVPAFVKMDNLKLWNEFTEPGIRYYSGTASYKTSFTLSESDIEKQTLYLDLGNMFEMGKVSVNGKSLNLIWTAPYTVDITEYIRSGNNDLEIEITNMWVNRLVGDAKLPESERFTKTNIRKFEKGEDKDLRSSGLVGPVRLISNPTVTFNIGK